ncbi:MAG: hypothetical protein E7393_04650 [Ruminococcaceae bacterium]|nr:hypothetical protein [Oscillospiraceae bacterium]
MLNKQIMSKLEGLFKQMNPEQKEKLNTILQDEDSLKKAIDGITPQKARQVAQKLKLDENMTIDAGDLVKELQQNPEKIKEINKKL